MHELYSAPLQTYLTFTKKYPSLDINIEHFPFRHIFCLSLSLKKSSWNCNTSPLEIAPSINWGRLRLKNAEEKRTKTAPWPSYFFGHLARGRGKMICLKQYCALPHSYTDHPVRCIWEKKNELLWTSVTPGYQKIHIIRSKIWYGLKFIYPHNTVCRTEGL